MRRFLIRVFVFCVFISFACVLLISALVLGSRTAVRRVFTLPEGVEIVSISDSHTQCGLAEESWPQFRNFSSSATAPVIWLEKLNWICHLNPYGVPRVIVLEHGIHKQPTCEYWSEKNTYTWGNIFFNIQKNVTPLLRWSSEVSVSDIFAVFTNWKPFDNYPPEMSLNSLPDSKRKIMVEKNLFSTFSTGMPNFDDECEQSVYVQGLEKIIAKAASHGSYVVLISTPIHADYRAGVPERAFFLWQQTTGYLTGKYEVPYFNYWDYLHEDEDFRDHGHLSASGRAKLTARFREDFERWEKEQRDKRNQSFGLANREK